MVKANPKITRTSATTRKTHTMMAFLLVGLVPENTESHLTSHQADLLAKFDIQYSRHQDHAAQQTHGVALRQQDQLESIRFDDVVGLTPR